MGVSFWVWAMHMEPSSQSRETEWEYQAIGIHVDMDKIPLPLLQLDLLVNFLSCVLFVCPDRLKLVKYFAFIIFFKDLVI